MKFGLGDPAALVFGGDMYHVQKARILGYIVYIMVPTHVGGQSSMGEGGGYLVSCGAGSAKVQGVDDNLNWVNECFGACQCCDTMKSHGAALIK